MKDLRVPARKEFLDSIRAYVLQAAAAAGAPESILFRIELAVEEALTNIIKYAYPGKQGDIAVSCSTGPSNTLVVQIRDWGAPFDPLHCETPNLTQNLVDRPIGGLGVYLIRKITDKILYCPLEDGNMLTLTFLLG